MKLTRVALVAMLALGILIAPPAPDAQQPAKVPTIGMLNTLSPEHPESRAQLDVFRQALRELGYVEAETLSSSTGGQRAVIE